MNKIQTIKYTWKSQRQKGQLNLFYIITINVKIYDFISLA